MATIGFVTASDLSRFFPSEEEPLLTHDDHVAAVDLRSRGHDVVPVVWGREAPAGLDLAIVRSPWDYQDSTENTVRFFEWLVELEEAVSTANPVALMRWNLDKRYLAELEAQGVDIVPTEFFGPERSLSRGDLSERAADGGIVLKPSVSAAAHDTFLIETSDAVRHLRSHNGEVPEDIDLDAWRGERTFLVQPFLSEIKERGEWSVVFLGGVMTHAVHKRPKPGDWRVQDELGGSVVTAEPPSAVQESARHAFSTLPELQTDGDRALYARIDVIETNEGPRVSEIELVEPELFFKDRGRNEEAPNTRALDAFHRGIDEWLR